MLAIKLSTLLVLAGSSFITAAFAVGGLIWVSGRESMVAVPTGSNFAPGKIGIFFHKMKTNDRQFNWLTKQSLRCCAMRLHIRLR